MRCSRFFMKQRPPVIDSRRSIHAARRPLAQFVSTRYYLDMESGGTGSEHAVAELIEQLGRYAHGAGFSAGLNPAQWTALRYFARANQLSCTVSAFAAYHGTTRGTASQTVKALVDKGFLERRPVEIDQRSFRLSLTKRARGRVADDPICGLVDACSALAPDTRSSVAVGLDAMLGRLRGERGLRPFGVCRKCRNLCREGRGTAEPAEFRCGLFAHAVGGDDLEKLCFNFEPRPRDGNETANVN